MESRLENPYFDLQAKIGITKHPGGLKTTRELIELCRIDRNTHVLDVGCGVGMSACYIAKKSGSRVVCMDISEKMIARSKERAKREGVEDRVEFQLADAQDLPFEDALFDLVISESATAFAEHKHSAINEYVRVIKPGGYVALNETTWIKTPPPVELVEYLYHTVGGVKPETANGWKELLEGAGLNDIVIKTNKLATFSQFVNEIRMAGFTESFKVWGRLFALLFKSSTHRKVIYKMAKQARRIPRNFSEYFGYGIYIGRK